MTDIQIKQICAMEDTATVTWNATQVIVIINIHAIIQSKKGLYWDVMTHSLSAKALI